MSCELMGIIHCLQRAPVGIVLSSSGTSQLGMFDIQATTKSKYYDHIVLLYLESRRYRYRSIIFVCFYLYVSVVNLIDYSDIDNIRDSLHWRATMNTFRLTTVKNTMLIYVHSFRLCQPLLSGWVPKIVFQ
jgi:hypothetical protein